MAGAVVAGGAKQVRTHAVLSPPRVIATRKTVVDQCIQVGISDSKDVASAPAIPPVGTAKFLVFFMTERDAARPAVSGRDIDIGFVNELHVE